MKRLIKEEKINNVLNRIIGSVTFIYYKDLACEMLMPEEQDEVTRRLSNASLVIVMRKDCIYLIKNEKAYAITDSKFIARICSRYVFKNKNALLINATDYLDKLESLIGDAK